MTPRLRAPSFVPSLLAAIAVALALSSCATVAPTTSTPSLVSIAGLRLIGTARLPAGAVVEGTPVGGLSGLDYDPAKDRWLAVSDDRSDRAPARFYTLRLDYDASRVGRLEAVEVRFLHQPNGRVYPNRHHVAAQGGEVADPESLRLDPRDGGVWYTSEGDEIHRTPPRVRRVKRDGAASAELTLPAAFAFDPAGAVGVRPNVALEGLTFTPEGTSLWLGMEGPFLQDGAAPTESHGAWARFTCVSRTGEIRRQVAYPVDAIYFPPAPGKPADNGVSEILSVSDERLLVLERNGAQQADGSWHFGARLYEAELAGATDVSGLPALTGATFQPVRKRLLVDFRTLRAGEVWNLEGLSWGRRLPNGHRTLLVISDDNFDARQATECYVFEVLPAP